MLSLFLLVIYPVHLLVLLYKIALKCLNSEPVELFIGILSSANHFAERMAVWKSWMMSTRRSSNIVARFFVALVRVVPGKHMMKCDDDTFVRIESDLDQV